MFSVADDVLTCSDNKLLSFFKKAIFRELFPPEAAARRPKTCLFVFCLFLSRSILCVIIVNKVFS